MQHHGPTIHRRSYKVGLLQTEQPHKRPKFKRSVNVQSKMGKKNYRTLKNDATHFVVSSARGYKMVGVLRTVLRTAVVAPANVFTLNWPSLETSAPTLAAEMR